MNVYLCICVFLKANAFQDQMFNSLYQLGSPSGNQHKEVASLSWDNQKSNHMIRTHAYMHACMHARMHAFTHACTSGYTLVSKMARCVFRATDFVGRCLIYIYMYICIYIHMCSL